MSRSDCDILSLPTLACWFMKMLVLDLMSVMVRSSWDVVSMRELASVVPFRPWMTFRTFGPSEFDILSWRTSFQLSALASLIASVASQQALIHACRFWCIVLRRQFQVRILACTCEVIQGLHFLLGLDLPTWVVSVEMRMSMKRETWRGKLCSSGRLFIFDFWTSFVKQNQSMSFRCHQEVLGTTAGNIFYD